MLSPEYTEPTPQGWLWLSAVFAAVLFYGMHLWRLLTPEKNEPIRPPWLWFSPSVRALWAWILCASLSVVVEYNYWHHHWGLLTRLPVRFASRSLSAPLPVAVELITLFVNAGLFMVWFEPLVLRLNVWRGLAWICLRITPFVFAGMVAGNAGFFVIPTAFVFSSVALMAPLWGWRSRPWMSLVSVVLVFSAIFSTGLIPSRGERWGWLIAYSTLYGIPLLFGTRLLNPKQRARSSD